jgi:hypothetical protein
VGLWRENRCRCLSCCVHSLCCVGKCFAGIDARPLLVVHRYRLVRNENSTACRTSHHAQSSLAKPASADSTQLPDSQEPWPSSWMGSISAHSAGCASGSGDVTTPTGAVASMVCALYYKASSYLSLLPAHALLRRMSSLDPAGARTWLPAAA